MHVISATQSGLITLVIMASSTIQRQVRDGRRFRAVKVALEPRSLERSLRELGWVIEVKPLAGPFLLGLGGRAG
ncbi:MAG TPA: hypothetical protein VII22_03160 [Streptosporangiaceae bacterium]